MGGSHTTWTEAPLAYRNSQTRNLRDKETGDEVAVQTAGPRFQRLVQYGTGPLAGMHLPPAGRAPGPLTCQLDVHVAVQQQVLGLEVPVDDVMAVAVLHS